MQDQLDSSNNDATSDMDTSDSNEDTNVKNSNNEVFMLLTGEQDLAKFLHWAMVQLYPHQHPNDNLSASAAEFYHPGMFIWKTFNFSGHLEPPLIVDEPQYVLVRREKQDQKDSYQLGDDLKVRDDPFIPPRGRKYTSPDLEELLQRHEAFVPNRGKRDKVKDLFKYDDLFYPNRGKKHREIFKLDDPFFPHRGKKLHLRDLYNIDDPFFPNRGKRNVLSASKWGKLQRKLQSTGRDKSNDNSDKGDNSDNWLQRMSTHEINGNDQSVKPSMSADDATEGASLQRLLQLQLPQSANRLQPTRSMSANLQRLRSIVNPGMRHQQSKQQQQQVKTSWPAGGYQHRWHRSVHDARETQLTRVQNAASAGHDTDIDIDYGQLDM
ncbi:GH17482 [Drosophila grimshawi]|uniref:GH17482 n=3 Tax=Drosophila grimshawi TaxID=7222 RepID=B4JTT4_DROGR|nr:GH17482 [Drosophila grimshawi]